MLSNYWGEFLGLAVIHFLAVVAPGKKYFCGNYTAEYKIWMLGRYMYGSRYRSRNINTCYLYTGGS